MERQGGVVVKYKVRERVSDDIETQILASRGVKDPAGWRQSCEINNWRLLNGIYDAMDEMALAIKQNSKICVIVDCDCDGFSSSAILINFLLCDLHVPICNVTYRVHEGKKHGLADMMDVIPKDTQLLIVPDAGTADYDYHDQLTARGCHVLILDHHQAEFKNPNPDVITVNPQLDDYPNKALTGAGVVWQFVRAYAELFLDDGNFYKYMDLCAFGNISDMADSREMEIRAIVRGGLSNITNPFLARLAKQNEYTINKYGGFCYKGCAFGLTPFVNAICRSGTIDEKRMVFNSMLEPYGYALVPSGKRGAKGERVTLAEEAVRIALNVKARQTKEQKAMVDHILETEDMNSDVNVVICDSQDARPEIVGLCSNAMQDKFKHPAIILIDYPNEKVYRGSARNCEKSPIKDFRKWVQDSGCVNYAMGHPSAFGVEISYAELGDFLHYCDDTGLDFENGAEVEVDYEYDGLNIPYAIFETAHDMKDCFGQQMPEVKIAVKDVPLSSLEIELLSPDKYPTLKFTGKGYQFVKFHSSRGEYDRMKMFQRDHTMTLVGTPSLNIWNDVIYPQVVIDDFDFEENWIF